MPPLNPLPPSPFPEAQLTKVWNFIIREISRSPHLTKVKPFQAWQGGAASVEAFAFDELPALRITPAGGDWRWADECRFDGPFILEVRIAVKGTRASDLIDFWAVVTQAIRPSNELMDRLQPLGPYKITPTAPALRPKLICEGQGIESNGHITILTNVDI